MANHPLALQILGVIVVLKKAFAIMIIIALLISVLSISVNAVDAIDIIIDLTDYSGEIEGYFADDDGEFGGIQLIAGQKNTFSVLSSFDMFNYIYADFTLTGFETTDYKGWKIEGSLGNGNPITEYIINDESDEQLLFLTTPSSGDKRVIISYNHFVLTDCCRLDLFEEWGWGTSLTFTPIISIEDEGLVSVISSDESQGIVEVATIDDCQYMLTATANKGFSFSYWLKEGQNNTYENRITNNPYFVTTDTEITYIAYFRDRYDISVTSEDEIKGTVAIMDAGSENGLDKYRLSASATGFYVFDKWVSGSQEYSENPLDISVSESGCEFIAFFKPIELVLSNNATYRFFGEVSSSVYRYNGPEYDGLLSEGCRSALNIPVYLQKQLEDVTIQIRVTNANDEIVANCEFPANLNTSDYLNVAIVPAQKGNSVLTAEVTLVTPAGSSTTTKTYTGFFIAESEINNKFRYITSPGADYGDVSVADAGPNIRGVYVSTDVVTKAVSLYLYGDKGVYRYDPNATPNLIALEGLVFGSDGILALGPNGGNGLTAAVSKSSTSLALYRWSGESWTEISGSALGADITQNGTKIAFVMAENDVWTDTKHWNGEDWEDHNYLFSSFDHIGDAVYAIDRNGQQWKYSGSQWSAVESIYPDVSSVTDKPISHSRVGIGKDQHGDWYLMIQGKGHFIDDSGWYSYLGSDIYKWNGNRWVYQIMSDFDDPDDMPLTESVRRIRPDGVNGIDSPAPGLSIMYGTGANSGRGSLFLSADNVTITFDPGEGALDNAALGTLTAPILSEINSSKVPGARRDGYTFGGWYYDEACTIEFDASSTAMPGESITLYAKYSDGNDPEAQLAWYKTRALKDLEKQYNKYSRNDYESEDWIDLLTAYNAGVSAINGATAGTAHIEDNVTAALNAAIAAMQAIPPKNTSEITIAISMDANTLGLGYLLEPTLVTVDKGTPVSVVIADLLSQQAEEKYGITTEGRTNKPNVEALATLYPWSSSGTPTSGFYLAQVYYPEQSNYAIPDTLMQYITGNGYSIIEADANGKYLGETDYLSTSGWMYTVGNKTSGNTEVPGIGSSGWGLSDGEVVRWQFTLAGYGADLGFDNTSFGGADKILTVGDKSPLTWKVAELRSRYSDDNLKTYEVYNDALAVLTNAEAPQEAIDAALEALNGLVIPVPQVDTPAIGNGSTEGTTENGVTTFAAGTAADAPTVSVTAPEGGWTMDGTTANSFTVSCENDVACVVLVKSADGSYTRLIAENAGTTHTFHTALNSGDEMVVVRKGDISGDGKLSGNEVTQIKAAQLKLRTFTEFENLVADLDGNGKLSGNEVTQIKAAQLRLQELTW